MDSDRFWQIVDSARAKAGDDNDGRVEALRDLLANEDMDALQAFQNHYDEMIRRSYNWGLWGAAYIMNGGCSDDGFRYFRDWLVSEGRVIFEKAVQSAESLAEIPAPEFAENELFGYVALELFEKKGGGELERDFSTEISMPAGDEWAEGDLPRRFPLLAKKYGFEVF
jgi:hypothetical protein